MHSIILYLHRTYMLVNLVQEFVCSNQVSRIVADYNFSAQFTFGQIASFYPCNPVSKHFSLCTKASFSAFVTYLSHVSCN